MPDKVIQNDQSIAPIVDIYPAVKPLGYQQILAATLAAATSLTPPSGTRYAIITPEAQGVRWRDDGTAPTATVGMLLGANGVLIYNGDFTKIQFIAATAGAILNVSYYQ